MISAPVNDPIDPAILVYGDCVLKADADGVPHRWYDGEILPGQVFAWEPDLPHARELLVVTRVGGPPPPGQVIEHARGTAIFPPPLGVLIWSRRFDGERFGTTASFAREVYNDEERFREAVVPTLMRDVAP